MIFNTSICIYCVNVSQYKEYQSLCTKKYIVQRGTMPDWSSCSLRTEKVIGSFEHSFSTNSYHDDDFTPPAAFGTMSFSVLLMPSTFWGVNLAGTLILVLCEYPYFEDFDDEVFLGAEDVIVVRVTTISLSVLEVAIEPQAKQTLTIPITSTVNDW